MKTSTRFLVITGKKGSLSPPKYRKRCSKNSPNVCSPRRPGERRSGLQLSEGMANSPIKASRLIFTTAILERIVKHTSKYGQKKLNLDWTPIDKADLTDFIAILFVMSIQKRKDKPSNWFSSNPLPESPVANKITTGRQFQKMLRYLHCCDPDQTATSDNGDYDPSYKILEINSSLEKRWTALFVPHEGIWKNEVQSADNLKGRPVWNQAICSI
ncbi:transposase IS4 [Nitzschia inconspicua]|uniref:Transposase IS4 n=1 Tax=Nitzschia inconspicua TaxID=303405 RepID=A0A9K3PZH3_9STRA|nr:transposase IS4 [Nitzschia inconspicua]